RPVRGARPLAVPGHGPGGTLRTHRFPADRRPPLPAHAGPPPVLLVLGRIPAIARGTSDQATVCGSRRAMGQGVLAALAGGDRRGPPHLPAVQAVVRSQSPPPHVRPDRRALSGGAAAGPSPARRR